MLGWFKKKKEKNKAADTVDHQEPKAAVSSPPAAAAAPPPEVQSEGLFKRLKNGLHKTRESLVKRVDALFLGKKEIDAELLDELEEVLITADLGVQTVTEMLEEARNQVARKELADISALRAFLQDKMTGYLSKNYKSAEKPDSGPFVIMVLGVNGVGKTTTIGKLAYKFKESGNKVLMVAADTFRAAAIDQLKIWGERTGVEVSAQKPGADPSSVVFDALEYAGSRDFDVILVDTAGRLHTQVNLIEELKKIKRVMNRKCPGAPHEVMLVLDATTGQNALSQTKLFNEAVELTALTLTKLDGTAKGGIVVNICREFSIPIRFIGVGEQMTDLRDFDAHDFIKAIFT
ncbi:Signal recognition particle receptor FtsY [hydrothermal vent metagenome]|uniref:Signal recognition particle receptor FtsY n=1 Tax=hydrothermal vent metagenome TaxID=652676 RepID=A0A3B0VFI1_9ZZZZ